MPRAVQPWRLRPCFCCGLIRVYNHIAQSPEPLSMVDKGGEEDFFE